MPKITLMLAGDVMTGRGIDQILPRPSPPVLYEDYLKSALGYVTLAEEVNGLIPRPVPPAYVWGDLPAALVRHRPDLRIVNLETAITRSEAPWPKAINYRMNPANAACLTAGALDCCVLANNHVLDWGEEGLVETLATLAATGIAAAGAGRDMAQAAAPAVLGVPGKGRVLVYGVACASSGVPLEWSAGTGRPGVAYLDDADPAALEPLLARIAQDRQAGDVVVCSIHWGPNWGYEIAPGHRRIAHALIEAGADIVHGHSSHHPRAVECHRDKLILYGCGDLLNDYEGIGGQKPYRSDLALVYVPTIEVATGSLTALRMVPLRVRRFRLTKARRREAEALRETIDRESRPFGLSVTLARTGDLELVR